MRTESKNKTLKRRELASESTCWQGSSTVKDNSKNMSTNEQFMLACERLKNDDEIIDLVKIIYSNAPGQPVSECIRSETQGYIKEYRSRWETRDNVIHWQTDIHDTEIDAAGWREYGKSIKDSKRIHTLSLIQQAPFNEITPQAVKCLQAFFGRLKSNQSIQDIDFSVALMTAISPLDLKHFFHNNKNLRRAVLGGSNPVTPLQSAHISTALSDVSHLTRMSIECAFADYGSCRQILLACSKIPELRLSKFNRTEHFTALSELLNDPATALQELYVRARIRDRNIDAEKAENDILASLAQNVELKAVSFGGGLFEEETEDSFAKLLCDPTSIDSVCQSNHTLKQIHINYHPVLGCEEYLKLNRILNKKKVVQQKIMQYIFGRPFDGSALANIPLVVLPQVLGLDVPEKHTAMFNILKSIPELCDAKGRVG